MYDPLMIVRGLSAIAISLDHMSYPLVSFPNIYGHDINWIVSANGLVFNWIFFILSGYLIGKTFFIHHYTMTPRGLITYIFKRIFRIVPAYYVVLVLNVLISSMHLTSAQWIQALTFNASHLLLSGIGHLWAVSIIMQFYVMAPALYFISRKLFNKIPIPPVFLIVFVILTSGVLHLYALYTYHIQWVWEYFNAIYSTMKYNLGYFILGFFLNFYLTKPDTTLYFIEKHKKILLAFLSLCFLLFYCLTSYVRSNSVMDYRQYGIFQIVIFPIMTMILCGLFIIVAEQGTYHTSYSSFKTLIKRRFYFLHPLFILQWIGLISYEYYLIHVSVKDFFRLDCHINTYGCTYVVFIQRFLLLVLLSILSAWILHETIRRLLSLVYRKIKRIHSFSPRST